MNECGCCGSRSKSEIEDAVKRAYSELWASQKDGKTCCSDPEYKTKASHIALIEKLSLRKGMRVLDVGSGSGNAVLEIAEKVKPGGKAVGVDFSPEGIALAKEKARRRNLQDVTEFHLANALELPFPDDYFDAVISECVVCLIKDKKKVLNEKVRVLKEGGKIVMHDVISRMPMPKVMMEDEQMYCSCVGGAVSMEKYVGMMKEAGLTDIEVADFSREKRKMLNRLILERALDMKDEQEFQEVVTFIRKSGIGYALFSGTKAKTK